MWGQFVPTAISKELTKPNKNARMFLRVFLFIGVLSCHLSGCGSSSDMVDPDPTSPSPPSTITGRFEIPQTGTARYSGLMNLNLPNGIARDTAVGTMALSIDFAATADQVTGQVTGFSAPSFGSLNGTLFITDGALVAEQGAEPPGFEAGISGALQGGSLINSLVTGDLVAEFEGTDTSTASGIVFGDVTTSLGIDIFDGSFSITKQ